MNPVDLSRGVLLGQPKRPESLNQIPLMAEVERQDICAQALQSVTQGVPANTSAMMMIGAIVRFAATLQAYEGLVRNMSDVLADLSSTEEKDLVEKVANAQQLVEISRTVLSVPMPPVVAPSPLSVGPGLSPMPNIKR